MVPNQIGVGSQEREREREKRAGLTRLFDLRRSNSDCNIAHSDHLQSITTPLLYTIEAS